MTLGQEALTSTAPDHAFKVSVIVPVYDTREQLPRCLDSVLNQTLPEIEVIAVDDCSTDDSIGILDRYARQDRRLKVVQHERNEGLHVARMTGVEHSSGQYVGYVDCDDYVSKNMFGSMYQQAVDHDAEIVRTGAWLMGDNDTVEPQLDDQRKTISFAGRTYRSGIEYLDEDFYPSMCLHLHHARLWRRALPHFPRIRLVGEDNLTSFVLAFFAGRVVSLPSVEYFYVERQNSISGDASLGNVRTHIEDRGRIVRLLREFLDSFDGRAERCWQTLKDNNRGLLFSYIRGLESGADRLAAIALFETSWGEPVPADLKTALSV